MTLLEKFEEAKTALASVKSAVEAGEKSADDLQEAITAVKNIQTQIKAADEAEALMKGLETPTAEKADKEEYYVKYHKRDDAARKNYLDGLRKLRPSDGVYLIDIVRNPRLLDEIRL